MSTVERVPVSEEWSYSGIRAEASHFVEALKHLYEREHCIICPPVNVTLTGEIAEKRMSRYDRRTASIEIDDRGRSSYSIFLALVRELASHIDHTLPPRLDTTEGPGCAPSTQMRLHENRTKLRVIAEDHGLVPRIEDVRGGYGFLMRQIGRLHRGSSAHVLELGKYLSLARRYCAVDRISFGSYVADYVPFSRTTAYGYIRAYEMDMPADLNYTTMRFLMRIRDEALRQEAIADAEHGVSLVVLRCRYGTVNKCRGGGKDEIARLTREKTRLQRRLGQIEDQIAVLVQTRTNAVRDMVANET